MGIIVGKEFRAAFAAAVLCVFTSAQAADPIFEKAARVLGVEKIQSLEFEASGKYFQFTQAPAPDLPWPPFDVDSYVATLDFERIAVHAKYHRVQLQEPGRARPRAEATMDQYASFGFSWNLTPAPTAIPTNLAERNAELWASPQGFVKAAITFHAKTGVDKEGRRVEFKIGKYRYEGSISAGGDVRYVRTYMDSPVLGDVPIEFTYRLYRDFNGVRFPEYISRRVAGMPWYELKVSAVRINSAAEFAVPDAIIANPSPSMSLIEVTQLAPGVWNFGGGSHNSVIVEQKRGLVVIEAPLNEERSLAILAELKKRFPKQRVLRVVNTHAHFDHAGGLRTFVAQGVPVVTHERNAAYYSTAWRQPRTLNPDRLAKVRLRPAFETFTDGLVLEDAACPIEIHRIEGSAHNDAFAMVYLPKQKILIEADAWTPTPVGATPPAVVNPLWVNLNQNIERLKLDVERVQPLHGTVRSIAELRAAIGVPVATLH